MNGIINEFQSKQNYSHIENSITLRNIHFKPFHEEAKEMSDKEIKNEKILCISHLEIEIDSKIDDIHTERNFIEQHNLQKGSESSLSVESDKKVENIVVTQQKWNVIVTLGFAIFITILISSILVLLIKYF